MKIVGYAVIGAGEADRHLRQALGRLKDLSDEVIVVLNSVDEKTRKMVEVSGVRSYQDNREWGIHQPSIKEDLVNRAMGLKPDWFLCVDADEVLEASREDLERLMATKESAFHVYVTQLWDDERHWRRELSFWNIRFWKARKDMGTRFESKALHCGLAPSWAYHYGWYAPFLLLHYGLMDKENRLRKAERYRKYDPDGKYKPKTWYACLEDTRPGQPLDREEAIKAISYMTVRDKVPTMTMPKDKAYVFVRRDDGTTVDIPERSLSETLKLHPTWQQVAKVDDDSEGNEAKSPPPLEDDPLECGICGEVAKTDQGLKAHKTRKHKDVRESASSETSTG